MSGMGRIAVGNGLGRAPSSIPDQRAEAFWLRRRSLRERPSATPLDGLEGRPLDGLGGRPVDRLGGRLRRPLQQIVIAIAAR
jgi:hypothetical protein